MLEYHGFGADEWEVFRQGMVEGVGGNRYFNPALARELSDKAIERLLPEHLAHPERHLTPEQNAARGLEAMHRVMAMREDVLNAMYRPEVGGISFYWGTTKGGGIAHLIARRNAEGQDGQAVAKLMPEVIANGHIGTPYGPSGGERRNVSYNGHTAVLSLYKFRSQETWLLTGWKDDPVDAPGTVNAPGDTQSRPSGIQDALGATGNNSITLLGVNGKSLFNAITPAQWNLARKRELDRIRTNLETQARAFLIDDTKFAVIEADAKSTAIMTMGTRRGTWDGELIRSIMQFKSVPIAFMQRILGGRRWRRGGMTGFDKAGMADYIVASLACGYIAMTLKDLSRNRTPKDPREPGTWFAASVRSGGAGVYGDFFLSKMKRFGDDVLATMAGPLLQEGVGTVATVSLALHGGGEAVLDKAMRMAMDNAPFINLWYTRAALDWAILDGVKEWMSPGYTRRMLRNMRQEFGQSPIVR